MVVMFRVVTPSWNFERDSAWWNREWSLCWSKRYLDSQELALIVRISTNHPHTLVLQNQLHTIILTLPVNNNLYFISSSLSSYAKSTTKIQNIKGYFIPTWMSTAWWVSSIMGNHRRNASKSALCFPRLQPPKQHRTWTSLSSSILFRLLCFKLYSNISVINIYKYNATRLFFSDKSIVLFELFDPLWKREASKNQEITKDQIIIKDKYKQHKTKISNSFALQTISNHGISAIQPQTSSGGQTRNSSHRL